MNRVLYHAGRNKRNMLGGGDTYRCYCDLMRRYRPTVKSDPARQELIDKVWAELKARPMDRREFTALVRRYSHPRRGGLAWCHLYRVLEAVAKRPRENQVMMAEGMDVATRVVDRNVGAFRELAKH